MVHLKNRADTEDIFQTVFLKYVLTPQVFESPEHEKAWIIKVTVNACRDLLKSFFRAKTVPLDHLPERAAGPKEDYSELLDAVLTLPEKYKDVVYLYYYEGYRAEEIGRLLGKKTSTVYTLLTRARHLLKEKLEGVMDIE